MTPRYQTSLSRMDFLHFELGALDYFLYIIIAFVLIPSEGAWSSFSRSPLVLSASPTAVSHSHSRALALNLSMSSSHTHLVRSLRSFVPFLSVRSTSS